MPVDSTHPEYKAHIADFIKASDVYEGSKAIKARTWSAVNSGVSSGSKRSNYPGSAYLPPLDEQSLYDYSSYRDRALFHNVTGRVADGLVGVMTRLPALVSEVTSEFEPYIEDFKSGMTMEASVKEAILSVLLYDRVGYLIDSPEAGGRPEVKMFTAPQIINWRYDDGGELIMVVISQLEQVTDPKDPFEHIAQQVYLVLALANGVYTISKYREDEKKNIQKDSETLVPTINEQPIDHIPFIFVNSLGLSPDINRAKILDILEINLSHYMTSGDLEHGRHFTALPTPVVTGVKDAQAINIGSTKAIGLPEVNAKAFYLEFIGEGLRSLEIAIKEKESQMATMSARLIDQNRKGSESSDTVRLRYAGESNMLGGISSALQLAVNAIFDELALWLGADAKPVVQLNTDFLSDSISAPAMKVLLEMYVSGGMDLDTYLYNLKRAELLPPGQTSEQYKAQFVKYAKEFTDRQNNLSENDGSSEQNNTE